MSSCILVTVESKTPLKGIFIQGRVLNATEPIGTFVNIPSETHLVKCSSVRIAQIFEIVFVLISNNEIDL